MINERKLNFLYELDKQKNKIVYAKITALTLDELPLQQIEGYVTQGSVNIDGASAVRRTCSLTIVSREDKFKLSDYYWGFNTKFKLEIGVENTVDSNYPDIIWFKQGVFIITSFSTSRSANNLTITLQGKDKMCLLNGEVGGNLESSVDFGKIKEIDKDGHEVIRKIPIVDIIKNMLVHYGRESEYNIILNDLNNYGLELLEYRGSEPLYLLRQVDGNLTGRTQQNEEIQTYATGALDTFLTVTHQGDTPCQVRSPWFIEGSDEGISQSMLLKELDDNAWNTTYDTISEGLLGKSNNIAEVWFDTSKEAYKDINNTYNIVKIQYGQTVGFRTTDLVFAGDLTANVGESLTSILDKIKNMLGDYEYFYDIDGRFVFQQKPSVYRRSWASARRINNENGESAASNEDETYLEKLEQQKSYVYNLGGTELITAFNNTPVIGNIKNDFSIWGQRPSSSGGNISIHLRCAIDKKPYTYRTIQVDSDNPELIEYNKKYNTNIPPQNSMYFVAGNIPKIEYVTSNEQIEVTCDWREIIFRMANDYLKYGFLSNFKALVYEANLNCPFGVTGYEQYYTDIQGFWRQLYNPNYLTYNNKNLYQLIYEIDKELIYEETNESILYPKDDYYFSDEDNNQIVNPHYNCWHKSVIETPETIIFWFDLIDIQGPLNKYSVDAIGRRTKVVNDTNIKAIFYEDTPTVIFVDDIKNYIEIPSGDYSYIQIPDEVEMFSISARGQSAMDKLDSLLYQHTYCTENASITTLPIYHLQPNTRIHIEDSVLGVSGDYIATKFSIQLSHAGTMAITATKAIDNIEY